MIPAHPLALGPDRQFDRQSQRAISRYYLDAGSGGLAVGVHSTQFAIREVGLYRPVLELAIETARDWTDRPLVDDRGRRRQDRAGGRGGAHRPRASAITPCCCRWRR